MRYFFRQPHALRRNGFQNFLYRHVFVQNFRINQAGGDAVYRNLAFGQFTAKALAAPISPAFDAL